jgi:hypothetical protein
VLWYKHVSREERGAEVERAGKKTAGCQIKRLTQEFEVGIRMGSRKQREQIAGKKILQKKDVDTVE